MENSYFRVPLYPSKNYVQRPTISRQLKNFFITHDSARRSGRRAVLYGLGGSGKTEVALQFAWEHKNHYHAVFWVSGVDNTTIQISFQEIAKELEVDCMDLDTSIAKACKWLERHHKWLMIIDKLNSDLAMEALEGRFLTASMNGDILITSGNRQDAVRWHSIEIADMSVDEGKELLSKIAQRIHPLDDHEIELLLNDLGHLPLAIEQAASFMFRTGMTPGEYRQLFTRKKKILLGKYSASRYSGDDRQTVMTTWTVSYTQVQQKDPQAARLLLLLSLMHNEAIPFEILKDAPERQLYWSQSGEFEQLTQSERWLPEELVNLFEEECSLRDAIATLADYCFIRYPTNRANEAKLLQIHPLVHFWASVCLENESSALQQQLRICAIGLVASAFLKQDQLPPHMYRRQVAEGVEDKGVGVWPWRQYHRLVPHALRCLEHAVKIKELPESVAHLSLSLLQVLEYSIMETFKADQAFSLSFLEHLQTLSRVPDRYLHCSIILWRLSRADLCSCRSRVLEDQDKVCDVCDSVYQAAEKCLTEDGGSARVQALKKAMAEILELDKSRFLPPKLLEESTLSVHTTDSWLDKYITAARDYLKIRNFYIRYNAEIPSRVKDTVHMRALVIAETFKSLCGLSSEEYRRSIWHATEKPLREKEWQRVVDLLEPIIEDIIENPTHSWTQERCLIRLMIALSNLRRVARAENILQRIQEAYNRTGKQLRAVENYPMFTKVGTP
jgi:hypothetical protein